MNKRRLVELARLVDARKAPQFGRDWTNEDAVDNSPESVLEVLRTLRDVGALGDVLKDERLELEALELLGEYETQ